MTFESCLAATEALTRSPLYGIARFPTATGAVEYEVSNEDIARDTAWAAGLLEGAGLGRGTALLAIGSPFLMPWLAPFIRAASATGATIAHADRWGWDARRSEMFVRRLPIQVVLGMTADIAQSLSASGLITTFERVPYLLAYPDAVGTLKAAGLDPGTLAWVGPATAASLAGGGPLRYNADEWRLDTDPDGGILVSTAGRRAASFDRTPVGLRGDVLKPGLLVLD
ncbi:hypothetical protein CcI49_28915 [Frankia sp. CcI49]|uniref:hypothetical protein n=1 Tax=Frankia sp. CcI49 TaxID=1745382 RepID=UPI00097575E2|nr:hypothetical protein [Frankia sp. CcI49]ONH55531.1 hypothetical protein CcI49_28915 [Frankia sp. CcI49]